MRDGAGLTRRQLLEQTARYSLLAGGVGVTAAACGGGSSSHKLDRPLYFAHDTSAGPLLKPFMKTFDKQYAPLTAQVTLIAQNIAHVLETRFQAGGGSIDVVFSDPGYQQKWYDAGWIQSLDGLPDLDTLNADIKNPTLLEDLKSSSDGKQIAVPYYAGYQFFVYNKAILDRIGAAVPTTWDELTDTCQTLKKKRILDAPFAPFWDKDYNEVVYIYFAQCASEGLKQTFDADTHKPTFDSDPIAIKMLHRMRDWYAAGLVAPDVVGSDYTAVSNLFAGGQAAFSIISPDVIKGWADPKSSKVSKDVHIGMMPGSAGATVAWMSKLHVTATTPNVDDAWKLARYLSWKDKNGVYEVPVKFIAQTFGLTDPYKGLDKNHAYLEALKFLDPDVLEEQTNRSAALFYPADRQPWFSGFADQLSVSLQEAILGHQTPEEALKQAANYARSKIG